MKCWLNTYCLVFLILVTGLRKFYAPPGSPPETSLEADVVHLAQEVCPEVQEAGVGVSRTPDGQNQRSQKVRACDLRQGGRTDFRVVFGERLNLDAG